MYGEGEERWIDSFVFVDNSSEADNNEINDLNG